MIPVSKPSITDLEKKYVNEALESTMISGSGDFVSRFEIMWAYYNSYRHGIACNSGTTAMHLALRALGIGSGDEVLVPEFTMASTAWAASYTGATPVFIDCTRDSLSMDPKKLESAITKKTRAIMPVHVYGRRVDPEVYEIARRHKLYIIEDMAEAHGIMPQGDIACYSFQGNKIITTGEGGMCLTDDPVWAEEIRKLSSLYFDADRTMLHAKGGYNYRMTNLQAAIGCAQVERIDELLEKRCQVEAWYGKYLPDEYKMPTRDVVWMYDIKFSDSNIYNKGQERMKKHLFDNGIDSRYGFKPMSQQPMYKREYYENLKAYEWSKKILYLPTYPDLTEEEIKYICKTISTL